jgi:hypothetical protein
MAWKRMAAMALLACDAGRCLADSAWIVVDRDSPRVEFAAASIESALRDHGYGIERLSQDSLARVTGDPAAGEKRIVVWIRPQATSAVMKVLLGDRKPRDDIAPEGFSIRRDVRGNSVDFHVLANGDSGAMYGGLELAEQIRTRGVAGVVDTDIDPYMSMRGVKFNVPLDLRTPSYSDMSDAGQHNIETVWDFEFWREYLDQLARHRYNFISLWNLHPFPSMVKVPEFPQVALNDVWRSNVEFAEDYSTRTTDVVSPAMLADKTVVKRLTIDEKIAFWRRVMEHARDRNIEFHIVTWNIYTYGVDGKYGITDSIENPTTRDYFRASVREMFRTYPLLRGMGLTAGENMGEVRMYTGGVDSFDAKENWLFATYGQGVLDAARAEPQRQFRLIHRQHESRAQDIVATFKPLIEQPNVDFVFSFKYAQAHALSSTTQTFHRGYVESLGDRKTLWTIRNDDALLLRWAAPDFVREFVKNIPREPSRGFYYGSDNWIPGRDFLTRHPPGLKGRLEADKHWLHTLLWGRLGYDPTLDNARVAALVALRFPGIDGARMLEAWQNASMIYPLVTGFHWADFDFQWYIEGGRSRPGPAKTESGFHSVETFINQPVHPGTDNIPIPAYVAAIEKRIVPRGTTPFEVADAIDARAAAAEKAFMAVNGGHHRSAERAATLDDILMMIQLGRHYAAKIRGATELALYRATRKPIHQQRALAHLGEAVKFADFYAARIAPIYGSRIWTNRVGYVDFAEFSAGARADVEIAQAPLK